MHDSGLCAALIDCLAFDVDAAPRFWSEALGRPVDLRHPASRGNYRMLATPPDKPIVQIQRVEHESRVHVDIETDDITAEVARLEKLDASKSLAVRRRWRLNAVVSTGDAHGGSAGFLRPRGAAGAAVGQG